MNFYHIDSFNQLKINLEKNSLDSSSSFFNFKELNQTFSSFSKRILINKLTFLETYSLTEDKVSSTFFFS
jgi:hypothetical protein